MKLSARNIVPGKVVQITKGAATANVVMVDDRQSWDDPVGAHTDATPDDRPGVVSATQAAMDVPVLRLRGYEVDQQRPN